MTQQSQQPTDKPASSTDKQEYCKFHSFMGSEEESRNCADCNRGKASKQEWWWDEFDNQFRYVLCEKDPTYGGENLKEKNSIKSFISHVAEESKRIGAEEERRRGREEEDKKWGAFLQKLAWKESEIRNAYDWVERTPLRLENDFTLSRVEQNLNE